MEDTQKPKEKRLGPRPLPYHLIAQISSLVGMRGALPLWRNGSLEWKPHLLGVAEDIQKGLEEVGWPAFEKALDTELFRRIDDFVNGVDAYRRHPYRRNLPTVPVVWQEGSTRLLDYSLPDSTGTPVLVVPSLINRAYILDLRKKSSFMRYLAEKGLRPYLVDWDSPGIDEKDFSLDDYIGGRLERSLAVVTKRVETTPMVVGYCMGGLLALALGLLCPDRIKGLVLIATPWDFHRPSSLPGQQVNMLAEPLRDLIKFQGILSADILQILFSSSNPGSIERKFRKFGQMKPNSAAAEYFVALEDWANDCVPLVGNVADQCLLGWYGQNHPFNGQWSVCGQPVCPEKVLNPTLLVVPSRDRIVPPESALVMAEKLPNVKVHSVESGHVSMMVDVTAKRTVYAGILRWFDEILL